MAAANVGSIFELFRTFEGEEFTVYVREDGKKFYVDFEEQKWRYFPDAWGDRGNFLPMDHDPYQVYYTLTEQRRRKQFPMGGALAIYILQLDKSSLLIARIWGGSPGAPPSYATAQY